MEIVGGGKVVFVGSDFVVCDVLRFVIFVVF